MDVNEELKFLGKFTKKNSGGGGVGLGGGQKPRRPVFSERGSFINKFLG